MAADALDVRMAHLEGAYEQIDRRLGSVETEVRSVRSDLQSAVRWIIGIILLNWITLMLAIFTHRG